VGSCFFLAAELREFEVGPSDRSVHPPGKMPPSAKGYSESYRNA